tara:strand:+ start:5195 stop:5893 length:699 start_codon:yes stop_codon:yes gene_type:complete
MTDVREFETYLYIRNDKFKIFLLDTSNLNNIYSNELILDNNSRINFEELSRFLDNNIFKIEKLLGKFIEDILLIIDDDVELQTIISIKKRNNNLPEKKILNQALIDSKDLFKENNEDKDIIHMIIENFMIDGKDCNFLSENLKSDYLNLDVKFITLPNKYIFKFNKLLENYQIKVKQFVSGKYLNSFLYKEDVEISVMAHKIINGHNINEITIVPKNTPNKGFFEKFFQLFS